MSIITMVSGRDVDLAYPHVGQIVLEDLARALSLMPRFNGQTLRPYSGAEHSLLVCEIAARELQLDVHGQLAALMACAHETYTGHLSPEAAREAGAGWQRLVARMEATVLHAFALLPATSAHSAVLRRAVLIAEATERAQLMPQAHGLLERLLHVAPVPWAELMSPQRCEAGAGVWEQAFLDRAQALLCERARRMFPVQQSDQMAGAL